MSELPNQLGRLLIGIGLGLVVLGAVLLLVKRLGWDGQLPGDLVFRGRNWSHWIPISTCVVLSVLLTVLINILGRKR